MWLAQYLRLRVAGGCGHAAAQSKVFTEIRGGGVQPVCGVAKPSWSFLALVYQQTDFSYTDAQGVRHRVVGHITDMEADSIERTFRRFADSDVPALTSFNMAPRLTIRRITAPLTRLSRYGTTRSWYPDVTDIGADADRSVDALFVIFQTVGIDQVSGQQESLVYDYGGLGSLISTQQTYMVGGIVGRNAFGMSRNLLKHEWGHGILFYFDRIGASPRPIVDNHINDTNIRYVHCPTGQPYILRDETDNAEIPNSIYNNEEGFTHDYYSGTTATPDQPQRCLGIGGAAWARGGPVTR